MLFNLFKNKNKNKELSEAETQWNKMWDMWVDGKIASPYNELMTYQSEVNNGGHLQYFDNTGNVSDLSKEMSALNKILPDELRANLQNAYHAYLLFDENEENEESEEALEKCDDFYYKSEEKINSILESFCNTL